MFRVLVSGIFLCLCGNVSGAGGVPLSRSTIMQKVIPHKQLVFEFAKELELLDQFNIREYPADIYNDDIGVVIDDLLDRGIFDYDPEYASILADIDRKHSLYKLTHRDLQWRVVASLMQSLNLSNEARVELIKNVRRYPLHRRLPATVAISPKDLENWQLARDEFYKRVKEQSNE